MSKNTDIYLQIYNTDLWPEFKFLLLDNYLTYNNLYIALCENQHNNFILNDISNYSNCYYDIFPNKGGDIGTFLKQLNKYMGTSNADSILKIHSKKSILGLGALSSGNGNTVLLPHNIIPYQWWPSSFNWRADLLYKLIGNQEIFNKNTTLLNQYNIGMIFPHYWNFDESNNSEIIMSLLKDYLHINYDTVKNTVFPAGSMFLIRSNVLKKYFVPDTVNALYDKMPHGPIIEGSNGSICHAIERIFGYCVTSENLRIRAI